MSARIVVAGTSSGAGKTTVACGLIAAFARRGLSVQGFKVGPDYIDPGHHNVASGRPPRNLDAFLSGTSLIAPLFRHGAVGADLSVIEGVMGLYDGVTGRGELASTAHVAKLLDAPVVLVVDAAAMARSAAAIVHGYTSFDSSVRVAGVIFNRVGSDSHEEILREAVAPLGVPVLGALRRDDRLTAPARHLGLVPAAEQREDTVQRLELMATAVSEFVDLDEVARLANSAPGLPVPAWSPALELEDSTDCRIAVASGRAFSFHYTENLELLQAAGAELVAFDPLEDEELPESADALLLAGGFPEVFAQELAANESLRKSVQRFAERGRPVIAECGGLLYLAEALDGLPMCGVLPIRGEMTKRLTLGYREAVVATDLPWLEAGTAVRGHEFHYSHVESLAAETMPAWRMTVRGRERHDGCTHGQVQAGYLHVHWAAYPEIAGGFVRAAAPVRGVA
jgi:cobyrinic acid a,c-diamide synthase